VFYRAMTTSTRKTRKSAPADTEAREAKLAELHATLEAGVAALASTEDWTAWLSFAGRFRRYSFNNQILIMVQCPEATHVAGYRAWQAMGRQVRKGEKAISILAPITRKIAEDDETRPVEQRGRTIVVGFRGASVFDISQTEGEPVPAAPSHGAELLDGEAPEGLWDSLAALITAKGFRVERCATANEIHGANGVTDFGAFTVTVRSDVSDAQAVKTLAHEAAHVLLHNPQGGSWDCREVGEVEAESVAFIVCGHHGMDSSGYTFGYVAGWAGRDSEAVAKTARAVLGAARAIIDHTDPESAEEAA
jgi:DNA primase